LAKTGHALFRDLLPLSSSTILREQAQECRAEAIMDEVDAECTRIQIVVLGKDV